VAPATATVSDDDGPHRRRISRRRRRRPKLSCWHYQIRAPRRPERASRGSCHYCGGRVRA